MAQQTLEQFIEEEGYEKGTSTQEIFADGVRLGAKWQQERMYSVVEVYDIIIKLFENYASDRTNAAIKDFEENFIKQ